MLYSNLLFYRIVLNTFSFFGQHVNTFLKPIYYGLENIFLYMEKGKSYFVLHPASMLKRIKFLQKEWSARKAVAQVYLGLKINQSFLSRY